MKKHIVEIIFIIMLVFLLCVSLEMVHLQTTLPIKTITTEKTIIKHNECEETKPSYEYLKSVTVRILGKIPQKINEDGSIRIKQAWGGTGVIIKIDKEKQITYILTNSHVATKNKEALLYIKNGDRLLNAQIIKHHKHLDMAVISVGLILNNKREIEGYANIKPQKEVYLVGFHLGKPYLYGEGVFAGYNPMYGVIQLPILFGNSGSGVFDKNGKLVGIVFAEEAYNEKGSIDVAHGLIIETYNIKIFLRGLKLLNI